MYNGERYLRQSIQSVVHQSYPNIQYIIIDGGSTDQTTKIISEFSDGVDIWKSEPDQGIYDAWNKGLRHAKGEWICFIGADDFFLDMNVIENLATEMGKIDSQRTKYVYGSIHQISSHSGEVIDVFAYDWHCAKDRFSKEMTLAHCGAFHHRSLFERHGYFNTSFRIAGDYEFLLREYRQNKEFARFVSLPVVAMRSGGISGTLKNRLRMAKESNLARKINGYKGISLPILLWIIRIWIYIIAEKALGPRASTRLADLYRILTGKKRRWTI